MNVELTPAIIGLAGVLVGGILQAGVQFVLARRSHLRAQHVEAYRTFFQGVVQASNASTDKQKRDAKTLTAEGRALVVIYGSEKVVDAMAKSFQQGHKIYDDGSWQVHAALLKAIREDSSGEAYKGDIRSLFEMLYGAKENTK